MACTVSNPRPGRQPPKTMCLRHFANVWEICMNFAKDWQNAKNARLVPRVGEWPEGGYTARQTMERLRTMVSAVRAESAVSAISGSSG